MLIMAVLMLVTLPLGGQVFANEPVGVGNPGAELWRAVRQRDMSEPVQASTQMTRVNSEVLINVAGENWQESRAKWMVQYGGYLLLAVLIGLSILWVVVKKSKIPGGRSGRVVTRMSAMQRIAHWFFAGIIGFMALTGLFLLFGRTLIIPVLGIEGFSPIASASKESHNLMGPLLVVGVLLMIVHFIRYNFPGKGDLKWLLSLGGLLTKGHPRVGYFNPGEKILYWSTTLLAIVLSGTGLLLLFPYFSQTASLTQLALLIHAGAGLLLIALAFAHIWMVRTVEGTLDAMMSGDVDENWAKTHHALWYESQQASDTKLADSQGENTGERLKASPANPT